MIESFIPSLSTYSEDIDFIFTLIFFGVGFWFLLAEGVLFWFIFKYRQKPDSDRQTTYMDGTDPKHTAWISRPHALILACDVVIIVFAVKIWYQVKQEMPPADETVRVIAQQWAWTFQHAGGDGKLDTADDIRTVDDMHIVAGKTYHYELIAKDVLHSFSVPVFRLKQDAIPGRVIKGWFKATKPGVFDIQCAEMCGIGHGVMGARILIESPDQHAQWLAANGSAAPAAAPAAAAPAAPAPEGAAPPAAPDGAAAPAPTPAAPAPAAPAPAAPPAAPTPAPSK